MKPRLKTLNVLHATVSFTVLLTVLGWAVSMTAAAQAHQGTLLQVSIENSDNTVTIRLIADQALYGKIQEITVEPFRLFVDFANIVPKVAAITPIEKAGVRQIRVALNQSDPPVTRVVLDLTQQHPYQIEQDSENREYRIVIHSSDASVKPKFTDIREHPSSESRFSLTPALSNDYVVWFSRTTEELEQLLKSPPEQVEMKNDSPEAIQTDWDRLRTEHGSVMPPSSLQIAHNTLTVVIQLGRLATMKTANSDETQDASNAARRGAELLLERARNLVESQVDIQKENFR